MIYNLNLQLNHTQSIYLSYSLYAPPKGYANVCDPPSLSSIINSGMYRATRTMRAVRKTRKARATRKMDTVRPRLLPLPSPEWSYEHGIISHWDGKTNMVNTSCRILLLVQVVEFQQTKNWGGKLSWASGSGSGVDKSSFGEFVTWETWGCDYVAIFTVYTYIHLENRWLATPMYWFIMASY